MVDIILVMDFLKCSIIFCILSSTTPSLIHSSNLFSALSRVCTCLCVFSGLVVPHGPSHPSPLPMPRSFLLPWACQCSGCWPEGGATGLASPKTKLRMMFLVPNLALCRLSSLQHTLIGTTFQSVANQNNGFGSYWSPCGLQGQSLHEDQINILTTVSSACQSFVLGYLQHVQELGSAIVIRAVTLSRCHSTEWCSAHACFGFP